MRVLDVLIAFPSLVLALAIAQSLGPSKLHTIYALCFFSVPAFARLARAQTLRLRERPFMLAARLAGTRAPRILLRHITPNILPALVTFGLLGVGVTIILEGALSFLGLGIPPPEPSWGNMIFEGQAVLSAEPKLVLLPSAFLFVTVLAFNLLGDALRARGTRRDERRSPGRRPRRGRHRPGERARCSRCTTCACDFHLGGRHASAPSTASATRSRSGARWRSSGSRARARPSARGRSWGCCPRSATVSGSVRFERRGAARHSPTRRCAATGAPTSRWSSRTRRGR